MKNETNDFFEQIVLPSIKGEVKAQEALFKHFYGMMMNICFRYAEDQNEAKDMLQDGFIRILQNLKTYKHEGSFEGWMKRIIVNSSIDHIRKNRKHVTISIDEIHDANLNTVNYNDAIQNISTKELMNLLDTLPSMSKTVFNLFVFDGYSHSEIAKKLNIKEGTSMWHVNNARTILKSKIARINKTEEVTNG